MTVQYTAFGVRKVNFNTALGSFDRFAENKKRK